MKINKLFCSGILFCFIISFSYSEPVSAEKLIKDFFHDGKYYGYGEGGKTLFNENYIYDENYHPLDKYFKNKNYLNNILPYSVALLGSQRFDSNWYPFMSVSNLELSKEEFNNSKEVVILAKFKTKHLYYDDFMELKYLEINNKEGFSQKIADGKNKVEIINKLFKNTQTFFAKYFSQGNISKKDFFNECQYFIKNVSLDSIHPKGAVLSVNTTEKHYFYLKKHQGQWKIIKIKRELIDYELDLN